MRRILCLTLALALLLGGCAGEIGATPDPAPTPALTSTPAPAPTPTPTDAEVFSALLAGVNAKNEALNAPADSLEQYKYSFAPDKAYFTAEDGAAMDTGPEGPVETLTGEAARAEVGLLFRLLRTNYGLYTWFGGDPVFEAAERALLERLDGVEALSAADYNELLYTGLSFVQDTHFWIGNRPFMERQPLSCNMERAFYRRGELYYSDAACTIPIDSVDGGDPAAMIQPSIDPEGRLTFYLFRRGGAGDVAVVRCGEAEERVPLTPVNPFPDDGPRTQICSRGVRDGIPWIQLNRMVFEAPGGGPFRPGDQLGYAETMASAEDLLGKPVQVIDLRQNGGGNGSIAGDWFERYTGEKLSPNYCTLRIRELPVWQEYFLHADEGADRARIDEMRAQMGLVREGDFYYVQRPEAQFVDPQGPVLLVLTGQGTASSAEGFTDMVRNLKNTLVIGTNTTGCLVSSAAYTCTLPYSGLGLQFGDQLAYFDPLYFSEGVGMSPDLYLAGPDADARLIAFVKRYL